MPVPISFYFALATLIFALGVIGILLRRNIIMMLMSVELMLNAVNLVFVAGSRATGTIDGQVMVFFVMTVAACEAAVGLAMVISIFRKQGTINTDSFRILRG